MSVSGDPLANLHHVLSWTRTCYTFADLADPFVINPKKLYCVTFLAVVSGRCEIDISDGCPTSMKSGQLMLLRDVEARIISNNRLREISVDKPHIEKLRDNFILMRSSRGGDRTAVVCCSIQFKHPAAQQLFQLLPPVNLLEATESDRAKCISTTLDLISALLGDPKKGDDMLMMHLADALLIETIRTLILRSRNAQMGWLAAIQDRQIGIAVGLMHDAPEREWSLVSLANAAGMSRSTFAERFTEVVGQTPMRYLAQLRMNQALTMINRDKLSISVIAPLLGYSSEASFSRAFQRYMGFPPSSARRLPKHLHG
jgi:AraC-like DNA-binding protein